jgi:hypothetical protein
MNMKGDLVKAAVTGATGALAGYIFLNEGSGSFKLFSLNVPTSLALFAASATGSLAADIAHDYILPNINKDSKLTNIESALLQLGVSGAATSGILVYGAGAPVQNIPNMFLLGAGSAVAGDYINSKFITQSSGLLF